HCRRSGRLTTCAPATRRRARRWKICSCASRRTADGMSTTPMADAVSIRAETLDLFRLAGIFIRYRLRSMRNAFRVRRPGRAVFAAIVGLSTAFAYVALFAQAFSIVVRTVGIEGQLAALALVTGTIAFGSLAARAASSEAVRAGSPENEFYLARPVSLASLV